VGQDSLNGGRIFNAGDDLDLPGAPLAGLDVNVEHPFESLHPGHRHVALGGRLVQPVLPGKLAPLASPSPPRRRNTHTKLAIGGEHSVKTRQIDAGLGNQSGQLRDEVQRFEPCVIKPIMSSSGKGQSLLREESEIDIAWDYAQEGGRAGKGKVIIEGFVDFDFEITLLTIRHRDGTSFCAPIGHRQEGGDYQESWQPQAMTADALAASQAMAKKVTSALGGRGLFGVELFIKGDEVIFSEVSPRPHDTGLVTLVSQDLSEFALHARAILDLPIPAIKQNGPSASSVILVSGESNNVQVGNLDAALSIADTQLRLFGKPEVAGTRRMGVALAIGESIEQAREMANTCADAVTMEL
jgi:phosphoribosylglycinamide formyltransferase 2